MRLAFAIAIVLALAGCNSNEFPTLTELLKVEDSGELDDATSSDSEQFEDVQSRYLYYLESVKTQAEKDAVRAACKRSMQRILERARQRVRDAEEKLRQAKDHMIPKASA